MLKGNRPKNLGITNGCLAECPSSPNCVSSQDTKGNAKIAPLTYQVTFEEANDCLKNILTAEGLSAIIEEKKD